MVWMDQVITLISFVDFVDHFVRFSRFYTVLVFLTPDGIVVLY